MLWLENIPRLKRLKKLAFTWLHGLQVLGIVMAWVLVNEGKEEGNGHNASQHYHRVGQAQFRLYNFDHLKTSLIMIKCISSIQLDIKISIRPKLKSTSDRISGWPDFKAGYPARRI